MCTLVCVVHMGIVCLYVFIIYSAYECVRFMYMSLLYVCMKCVDVLNMYVVFFVCNMCVHSDCVCICVVCVCVHVSLTHALFLEESSHSHVIYQ